MPLAKKIFIGTALPLAALVPPGEWGLAAIEEYARE